MAYLLGNLIPDALRDMGVLKIGRATSGSTTTILETSRPSDGIADADYTRGSAYILRSTDGAAPQGEFARITSYATSSVTFTLTDTLTAAVGNGDRYGVYTNVIPLDELIELAKDALQPFDLTYLNESLTTAADQTEYDLPVALKQHELIRVRYQGQTTDANDNRWIDVHGWDIEPAAGGSTGVLIIPQLQTSRTLQLWYRTKHSAVNAYSDVIDERIDPQLARAAMVERLRNREVEQTLGSAAPQRRMWDKAKQTLEEAMTKYPVFNEVRQSRGLILNKYADNKGGPNSVSLS